MTKRAAFGARAAAAAVLLGALLSAPALAPAALRAQSRLIVRAETRIELEASGTPARLEIHGALRDDLGAPLVGRTVVVWLEGDGGRITEEEEPITGDGGVFTVTATALIGECTVHARYAGEPFFLESSAEHHVDVRLAPVDLSLGLEDGGRLDLDVPTHDVSIELRSVGGIEGVRVRLSTELGTALGEATTSALGTASVSVLSTALGGPSAGRIVASTDADASHAAARVEIAIVRFRGTSTSLGVSREDDEIVFSGDLTSTTGPRPGEAISLLGSERLLATALTDASGHYTARVPLSDLDGLADPVALVARFESDAPWIGDSESPPIVIHVGSRLPSLRTVFVMVSFALAVAVVLLSLRRPTVRAELAPARTSVIPSARVGGRHVRIGVRVRDARTRAAIAGAELRMTPESGAPLVAQTDERGRVEVVLENRTLLVVDAPGYEELRTSVPIPHRGEWLDAELRLSSLRDAAAAPLRPIAEKVVGSPDLAATATAREVLAAAERKGPTPGLGALVNHVERATYGAEAPTAAEVDEIRGEAARAMADLEKAEPPAR